MSAGKYIGILFFVLQGCSNPFINPPAVSAKEAIREINKYGVTLSTLFWPLPKKSVVTQLYPGDPSFVSLPTLNWFFTPHSDYSQMDSINLNELIKGKRVRDYDVSYTFLVEDGLSSTAIPSTNGYNDENPPNSYSGIAEARIDPSDLITKGNFILVGNEVSVPLTATHIKVTMQLPDSNEEIFIAKVPLDKLTAWQKYIKPVIDDL